MSLNSLYSEKLGIAFRAIDDANRQDPNKVLFEGINWPVELLYGHRMTACLDRYFPDQGEAVQLAARAQHICRWQIARSAYPMDRKGYYAWRNKLKLFHGEKASEILQQIGYDEALIERVKALLSKKALKKDREVQLLEDVICLVFLQYYFEPFAAKHTEEKLIGIIQKTWRKMSGKGQQAALDIALPETLKVLILNAVKSISLG